MLEPSRPSPGPLPGAPEPRPGTSAELAEFGVEVRSQWRLVLGRFLRHRLALGSLALLMLQYLTGGAWGIVIRRPAEAAARTLPLLALMFLPIVIGIPNLYEWSHADILQLHKLKENRMRKYLFAAAIVSAIGTPAFADEVGVGAQAGLGSGLFNRIGGCRRRRDAVDVAGRRQRIDEAGSASVEAGKVHAAGCRGDAGVDSVRQGQLAGLLARRGIHRSHAARDPVRAHKGAIAARHPELCAGWLLLMPDAVHEHAHLRSPV